MVCLFAIFAGLFPRIGAILLWIARPVWFSAAFNGSWFWPLLGVIFLPFTTLIYVILWYPAGNLTGWDWLWIGFAVVLDVMHASQTAYSNRHQIPGYAAAPASGPSGGPPPASSAYSTYSAPVTPASTMPVAPAEPTPSMPASMTDDAPPTDVPSAMTNMPPSTPPEPPASTPPPM